MGQACNVEGGCQAREMTPLVLIPRMMCDARMWGGFTAGPCELLHVLPTEHDTVAGLAAAFLDHAPQRFALVGLSVGGIVAIGEDDRLCPRDRHEFMNALMPQSILAIIPRAGHFPPLENPEATYAHLHNWLSVPE